MVVWNGRLLLEPLKVLHGVHPVSLLFFLTVSVGKKLEGSGDAIKIFPATRSSPLQIPETSIFQRAEQGVRCLAGA
jgi:hypothetical protein